MKSEGTDVPAFSVVDQDNNTVTSESLAASGKTSILYFYPRDDTPGCTIEAKEFRDLLGPIKEKGGQVYGVSKDPCASHKDFIKKYDLNFPLLADTKGDLYKAFGITGRATVIIAKGKILKVYPSVTPAGHAKAVLAAL
eukprot:TRINITY_DN10202_c0_g1_i1.p2 TRINITY_DN10202_c0_g1~~TRINITY_DN10202_c0_g1_i1.p2  ORF type:complete len:139 (-),score=33.56 TRINITY_DN10202_c0_g1_i1:77-493(-)